MMACASVLLIAVILWFRDVIREASGGYHASAVASGLLIGFILFLLSEIMLFVSFFWAFLHASLSPVYIIHLDHFAMDTWAIPLFGSTILLASGFFASIAHSSIAFCHYRGIAILTMVVTILLGIAFLGLQLNEYWYAQFTMADAVFGSVFYMTTGLHGLHVIIGVIFLTVGMLRILLGSFTTSHHMGFEMALFYWHLVDVVWLMVFIVFYASTSSLDPSHSVGLLTAS